jgi:phosphatidylserine/phosphatidylglycerophosphate/cardiolipin synthase-like enzyme
MVCTVGYGRRFMAMDVLRIADRVAGKAIERLASDHHARRLGKLGRSAQRTPPDDGLLWAAEDPPPRSGKALDVLIDGAAYFPALVEAIGRAQRSVLIAGWCLSPQFALIRDEPPILLREVLGEAAESVDVRVLLWAGVPVPVSPLRRDSVRRSRDELVRGTRVKVALDSKERPLHCHHEKLVVIDDQAAFIGGIDLTDLRGDRYDTAAHPARGRMGWHDVASRIHGPAVSDVSRHLAQRWQAVTGEQLESQPADVASAGAVELQIVRTVPEKLYNFAPRGDFQIIESYLRALRSRTGEFPGSVAA